MIEARFARSAAAALASLALLVVSGCDRGATTATTPASKAVKKAAAGVRAADADVVEASRRMAAGVPVDSSTAPVEVRFELPAVPTAGQQFEVDVGVLPSATTPLLHLDVRSSAGLSIDEPDGPVSIEKVQAGTLQKVAVKLTSAKPGTRVLSVKVTLDLPTGAESRDFAFPLIIGAGAGTAGGAGNGPGTGARKG